MEIISRIIDKIADKICDLRFESLEQMARILEEHGGIPVAKDDPRIDNHPIVQLRDGQTLQYFVFHESLSPGLVDAMFGMVPWKTSELSFMYCPRGLPYEKHDDRVVPGADLSSFKLFE